MTAVGLLLIAGSSWTLGTIALARTEWRDLRAYEQASLRLLAGLGLTALLCSLVTLVGGFALLTYLLAVLAAVRLTLAMTNWRRAARQNKTSRRSSPWQLAAIVVIVAAGMACAGAIAPVTDDDALAYVVPIAQHIAKTGQLTVWPDQARSMWPQSQQVLLAFLTSLGAGQLGSLTAFEFLLSLGAASALARRACERPEHIPAALIIGFGSPVVAFQVASAKEDLLVVAAAAAAASVLIAAKRPADFAIAGLFAGIGAGAKYPGVAMAVAALAWPFMTRQPKPLRAALLVLAGMTLTGGLWYLLNLWRYGNPVAPFLVGAPGTTLDAATVREFVDGYGIGRVSQHFFSRRFAFFSSPDSFAAAPIYTTRSFTRR